MKFINKKSKEKSAPIGLDENQELMWNYLEWHQLFSSKRSRLIRDLFVEWIKVNIPLISIAVLIGGLIYLYSSASLSGGSLVTLAISIITASVTILAIITAFLTFWFGNAINNMKRTHQLIRDELLSLEEIKRDIEPYTTGPQDTVTGEMRENVIKLAKSSTAFREALVTMGRRFHQSEGTYYKRSSLELIDQVIKETGGEWFVTLTKTFPGHDHYDLSKKNGCSQGKYQNTFAH